MKIEVTQEDIDKAMALPVFQGDWASSCPVAEAIKRKGYEEVFVMDTWLNIGGTRYYLQPDLTSYISNIDHHRNRFWRESHPDELLPIVPAIFIL